MAGTNDPKPLRVLEDARFLSDAARQSLVDGLLLADERHAVIVTDAQAHVLHWNAGAVALFGWSAEEAIGRTTVELMEPDPSVAEAAFDDLRRGGTIEHRVTLRHRNGDALLVETITRAFHEADGRIAGYIGTSHDVTAESRTQAALRQSEARFDELMANLRVGIWMFDAQRGEMEYVSPGYEAMFGVTLRELKRGPWAWLDCVHPDDRDRVRAAISANPQDFEVEYRFFRPGGGIGTAHGRSFSVRGADGLTGRVAGIATDITDLRATEEHMRQLGEALEQTSDGVLLLDAHGAAIYANPAYARITGMAAADVVGHLPPALPGTVLGPEMLEHVDRGEVWKGNIRAVRMDGSPYTAEVTVWPVAAIGPASARYVVIVRDVSVEEDLSQALAEESRVHSMLMESLARLSEGATAEEIAAAACDEAMAVASADVTSVLAIDRDGTVTTMAFRAPDGAPLRAGQPLPAARAAYLAERASTGAWIEDWRPREADGGYGLQWSDVSLNAAAYVPILARGELAGLLVVGSREPGTAERLSKWLPALQELATMSGALLAEHLVERLHNGALRAELEAVIHEREFSIAFQPVIDLSTGLPVGYEALSRFNDGTPPDRRFEDAALAGVGIELEEATLAAAVASSDDLPDGAWLALNVSPAMATDLHRLCRLLEGVSRPVVLEITERTPIVDYAAIHEAVNRIQPRVRLAVDDAGAGFASLRHILELRPEIVKLDIGLVRGIDRDPARRALVAGMVYYAGATGCELIAEGIETEAELASLRGLGVKLGQGYLLGRPMPVAARSMPVTPRSLPVVPRSLPVVPRSLPVGPRARGRNEVVSAR